MKNRIKHPDVALQNKCVCSQAEISHYRDKLSVPLLDRIDLKVFVSEYDDVHQDPLLYASTTIRAKIQSARDIQTKRYKDQPFGLCNADVPDGSQFERCTKPLSPSVKTHIQKAYRMLDLTKRMEVKLMLVARTIADLDGQTELRITDVNEAIELMGLEHPYFRAI